MACAIVAFLCEEVETTFDKWKLVPLLEKKMQQLEACLPVFQLIGEDEVFLDRAEHNPLK